MKTEEKTLISDPASRKANRHYFRFHLPHTHLASLFGDDWFALKAEAFARFFGTPVFLVAQTVIVAIWICANVFGITKFDVYPFILLNLAFSLQAAYAAPLILLAQTRQADRDKAQADADARHREDLAIASEQRLAITQKHTEQLMELLQQNTQLTELTQQLSQRIEMLTIELHHRIVREKTKAEEKGSGKEQTNSSRHSSGAQKPYCPIIINNQNGDTLRYRFISNLLK